MQLTRARLYTRIPQRSELAVWDDLRTEFGGVLNGVKSAYWKTLGLDFGHNGDARPGDIYWAEGGTLLYYYVAPTRDFVEAGCVAGNGDSRHLWQGFCDRIRGSLGASQDWKPYHDVNPTYQVLLEEASRITPETEEIQSAQLLSDRAHRELLRKMSAQGSSFLEALAVGQDLLEVGSLVADLEQHKLLQREYVVVCKKSGQQISRVKSLDEIEAVSRSGFKCPHCGSSYLDERVDQLVACTPVGERMARPNYWLALSALQVMEKLSLPTQGVLHLSERDYGILDLFVNREGDLLMVEPHDQAIRLNDAFMFCARARYYRPQVAVLVTAGTPPADVQRYLSQASTDATTVLLAVGVGELEQHLRRILAEWQRDVLRHTLERFQPGTLVDVGSLLSQYFFGAEGAPEAEPADAARDSDAAAMAATPPDYQVADKPLDELPPQPMEEAPGVSEPELAAEIITPPAPDFTEQPAEMAHDTIGEPIDDVAGYGADFYETLEAPPLLQEHTLEDLRELAIKQLVDSLHQHGLAARLPNLEKAFHDQNLSAALVSDEGLTLAARLDPVLETELVSALAVEVADTLQKALAEAEFKPMSSLTARSTALTYTFHPLQHALLLVHEKRTPDQSEEEPFHMQSEMDLRDAILKRVLDELSRLEGVKANIVVNREGLVIDHQAPPEQEDRVHMWAAVFSQTLVDAERSLQRMNAVPLRQMLVWTADQLISLIPLDREGILLSLLEPTVARDTYSARLLKAATMLTSVFL